MNRITRPFALIGLVISIALVGLQPATVSAELSMEQADAAIKYRQNVMTAIGGLMGTSIGQLRDGISYGPSLQQVTAAMQALSSDVPALFPKGSDFGETDAKPEVWEDPKGFQEAAAKLSKEVDAFAAAVQTGDKGKMLGAFKNVGDACKGCHEDFRVKR